jgi:hypothetical protein
MEFFEEIFCMGRGCSVSFLSGIQLTYVSITEDTFDVHRPQRGRLIGRFCLKIPNEPVAKYFDLGHQGIDARDNRRRNGEAELLYDGGWLSIDHAGYRYDEGELRILVRVTFKQVSPG